MKKKTLVALLMAGCMAFAPSAVYAEAEEAAETTEASEEETEAAEETEDEAETEESAEAAEDSTDSAELSDDLYSFQVSIDGVVYQLPMTYEELVAQGWKISKNDDPEEMVPSNSYTYARFNKGEQTITVDVINFSINEQPVNQCLVGAIEVDANYDFNA